MKISYFNIFVNSLTFTIITLLISYSNAVIPKPKLLNLRELQLSIQELQNLEPSFSPAVGLFNVVPRGYRNDEENVIEESSATRNPTPTSKDATETTLKKNISTTQTQQNPQSTSKTESKPVLNIKNTNADDSSRLRSGAGIKNIVSPNGNNLIEYTCRHNDSITQQACFEYCTKHQINGKYHDGKCSGDETLCVCSNKEDGSIKKVKLYRPNVNHGSTQRRESQTTPTPTLLRQHQTHLTINAQGRFNCDNTPESKSICQVFCTTKGSTHSSCSLDHKACLCFKSSPGNEISSFPRSLTMKKATKTGINSKNDPYSSIAKVTDKSNENSFGLKRNERNLFETEERVIGLSLMRPKQYPFWPMRPIQQHIVGVCTPYSCVDNCPRGCDNLCTHNLQCYCSCPEDTIYYDYVDDGPIPPPPFSYY